jgi:DNA-binding CsgD family transcriptional regulator
MHYPVAVRIRFTPKEHQIAILLEMGANNKQIREALHIARKTLANHLMRMRQKLRIESTRAAAIWLKEHREEWFAPGVGT